MPSGEEKGTDQGPERVLYVCSQPFVLPADFPHPGGDKVLQAAHGKEVGQLFTGKSGGHAHSDAAWQMLWEHHRPELAACTPSGAGQQTKAAAPAPADRDPPPVDCSLPILSQVYRLPPSTYAAWVHAPVPGHPRFFASGWLESVTKVQWWVVPLIWLPVAGLWLVWAARRAGWAPAAALALLGAAAWQAIEYGLHRWVFHAAPRRPWAIWAHFLLHGCHHKFPLDTERLVFPPLPAAAIAAGIYRAVAAALPPAARDACFAGILFGYVRYDVMHYLMHAGRLGGALKSAHMRHHYVDAARGFGISGGAMDWLLASAARPAMPPMQG